MLVTPHSRCQTQVTPLQGETKEVSELTTHQGMIAIGLRRCQNEAVNAYYKMEMPPSQLTPPPPSQRLAKDTLSMPDYVRRIGAGYFGNAPDRVRRIGGQGVNRYILTKLLPQRHYRATYE